MKHGKAVRITSVIDKFKHGYGMVSPDEGSPAHYHLVAVALGLGIGVVGLCKALHIPWVSRQKDFSESEIVYYVCGLQNLGNNCFLNVILQALASCDSFLPFLKNVLEIDEGLSEEKAERMPLIFALSSLLEDLCIIQDERTVLNPRRVMHALSFYVSNFNLTRQQDASEAVLHLFSSLRDELSLYYVPRRSSLADITLFHSKIYEQREGNQPECKRWKQNLFGPFDGTIGSILSCRNCSCVLSMDFENFHCLPLSPLLDINGDIINGCTLVDCLQYFTAVERLDNYRCDRCWHIAATKYVSLKSTIDKEKVNKLRCCVNWDTCSCRSLFSPEEIIWSGSSHALKQLVITNCPKILCIHLQRASMNENGEFIKHEGHISFPLFLNLSPFSGATSSLRQGTSAVNMQKQCMQRPHLLVPQPVHMYRQLNMQMPPHMFPMMGNSYSNESFLEEIVSSSFDDSGGRSMDENGSHKNAYMNVASSLSSSRSNLYGLSAVVEHYGRYGGGHYAAYRRVTSGSNGADQMQPLASGSSRWFYVSDRHVSQVSEDVVLAAEATLLFYEKL